MNQYDTMRLGLILAIQAEIEGMKSENEDQKYNKYQMAYNKADFEEKAEELRVIVYKHDEHL